MNNEWHKGSANNNSSTQSYDISLLLGSLRSQMSTLQTDYKKPASKGICVVCEKPIMYEIYFARGRTFHPECHCCTNCRQMLGTNDFYYKDNITQYCENCYHSQNYN